jgi:hypothetical protein
VKSTQKQAITFEVKDSGHSRHRRIQLPGGRIVSVTPVFDTYWRFAKKRQDIFMQRVAGACPPYTNDPVLSTHRFTNAYRASDRVSQFLIRHVLYEGDQSLDEVFFRTILFKLFNRISTWNDLIENVGHISWKDFVFDDYAKRLDEILASGRRVYSAAYIMPSPDFGDARKHRNHLRLVEHMMRTEAPKRVANATSLEAAFKLLRGYPSLGDFLAFQFTVDLNYSSILNFPESQFVVAGPGARDGIRKCFADTAGLADADLIHAITEVADREFDRLGLTFQNLWGRKLQPIDCQNIFCEVDKYARVVHPEFSGDSGRSRIKQKFSRNCEPLPQWYPPKWKLQVPESSSTRSNGPILPQQLSLA